MTVRASYSNFFKPLYAWTFYVTNREHENYISLSFLTNYPQHLRSANMYNVINNYSFMGHKWIEQSRTLTACQTTENS